MQHSVLQIVFLPLRLKLYMITVVFCEPDAVTRDNRLHSASSKQQTPVEHTALKPQAQNPGPDDLPAVCATASAPQPQRR